MDSAGSRIWRPTIEPTSKRVPEPGSSNVQHHVQELYTKTSLAADTNLRNLNREILSASQAYNNTPKPFKRQTFETSATTPTSPGDMQQVKFNQQGSPLGPLIGAHQESNQTKSQTSQEENMAPKLVHKQYNSPIDLYSMNNIRKTIEAHSELIAPGIKGINFMKPETPVNKQSEVYKLVKEEEQHRNSRMSPISGQPISNIDRSASVTEQRPIVHNEQHLYQRQLGALVDQQQSSVKYSKLTTSQSLSGEADQQTTSSGVRTATGGPNCCECGQFIKGPFAKIQNRFLHPQCFNCTTCGTSLKNTGYFTINEKLYCEIHARQVAKVMRLQFDFGQHDNKLNQSTLDSNRTHHQADVRFAQVQTSTNLNVSAPAPVVVSNNQSSCSNNNSTVTISTMFANRVPNHSNQQTANLSCTSTVTDPTSNRESARIMTTSSSGFQQTRQAVQQQMANRSCGSFVQERETNTLVGARTPICVHCHGRIQGPYVLAGKTTWCKLCSQNNFQCSSCYRSLLDTGFIEDSSHKYYCEHCFEAYYAPICSKCNIRIKGDCLNALNKQWHPSCFVCGHCHRPFGNSSFYLEDQVPFCERDWNILFTTKCFSCCQPIDAGDKWVEALNRNYHSNCFKCTSCQTNLEGSTFYCKGGKPYCRLHAK